MDVQSLRIDRGPRRRAGPARRRRSPWFGRALFLLVLAGVGFALRGPIQRGLDWLNLPRVEVLRVEASRPAEAGAVEGTAANGYVIAARRAALSADTPGRIVEMRVTEGSTVQAGDVVAVLFQDEYRAALQRSVAAVATASASVERAAAAERAAEVRVEQSRRNRTALQLDVEDAAAQEQLAESRYARVRELLASGISSQDEVDGARAALDSARARQRAAQARETAAESSIADAQAQQLTAAADRAVAAAALSEAEAARDLAAATLDKTEVRAPFDGVVVLKDAEVGEVVSPNSQGGSNARGSICTMVDFDSLEVQADVPESSLQAVRLGGQVQIFLDAFPERAYAGTVDRIWPTADRQKATVEVRVAFAERDELLRPDMGARLVFVQDAAGEASGTGGAGAVRDADAERPVILLPASAVVAAGAGAERDATCFVYERGVVKSRQLELGARKGRRVTVLSGLAPGEQVVLAPPADLEDGQRVQLRAAGN